MAALTTGLAPARDYAGSVEQASGVAPEDDQIFTAAEINALINSIDDHASLIDAMQTVIDTVASIDDTSSSTTKAWSASKIISALGDQATAIGESISSIGAILAVDDAAYDTLQEVVDALKAAQADVVTAQSTADTATTDAATAQAAADAAQTTADTGVTNAATAQSTADTATTDAATAQSAADAAQTTADTAVTNAATAQSTADTAVTDAAAAMADYDTGTSAAMLASSARQWGVTEAGESYGTHWWDDVLGAWVKVSEDIQVDQTYDPAGTGATSNVAVAEGLSETLASVAASRQVDILSSTAIPYFDEYSVAEADSYIDYVGGAYADLEGAVTATRGASFKWTDHPKFPSVRFSIRQVDMSSYNTISLRIYSEVATGERVLVALRSPEVELVPVYNAAGFTVDWTGWKDVTLNLSDFAALGKSGEISWTVTDPAIDPIGVVDTVALFTKVWGWTPSPSTVLEIDDISLNQGVAATAVIKPVRRSIDTTYGADTATAVGDTYLADTLWLNHTESETALTSAINPLTYGVYSQYDRALPHKYFPRYVAGPVSFSPTGKPYVYAAGHLIQSVNGSGVWSGVDLLPQFAERGAQISRPNMTLRNAYQNGEHEIRIDNDGDWYVLSNAQYRNEALNTSTEGWLHHSQDDGATWTKYVLPSSSTFFERQVGNNTDALAYPPVMLTKTGSNIQLIVPTKTGSTLDLSPRATFSASENVGVYTDNSGIITHSGAGTQLLSLGTKVYYVYSLLNQGVLGAEAYIVSYDRVSTAVSSPVYLGLGGTVDNDNHNWPTICVDDDNRLHVVINGHHEPFKHVVATNVNDGTAWETPVTVSDDTSYIGIISDSVGTLYGVSRSSANGYRFELRLHKKTKAGSWTESTIITPDTPGYRIWMHKLCIHPTNDDLYLFYYSQSQLTEPFLDESLAETWMLPSEPYSVESLPTGTRTAPGVSGDVNHKQAEPTVIVSKDGGTTWMYTLTSDFVAITS